MNIFGSIILFQIFIFVLGLILVIGYFSLRKLVLPCFGCSKGSWWYTCAANTGYGTDTCELYKKTYGTFATVINSFYLIIKHFSTLFETIKIVMKKINIIPTMGIELTTSINNINNKIKPPDKPYVNEPRCAFMGIDVCGPIRSTLQGIINGFYTAGGGLIKALTETIRVTFSIFTEFLKLIINGIVKLCTLIIENITKPIKELINLISELTKEISDFIDSIINLGIINIIIFNIISFLNILIPGPIIALISYAGIILFTCIVLPIIGFIYIFFSMIFSIIIFPFKLIWWIISNILYNIITIFI